MIKLERCQAQLETNILGYDLKFIQEALLGDFGRNFGLTHSRIEIYLTSCINSLKHVILGVNPEKPNLFEILLITLKSPPTHHLGYVNQKVLEAPPIDLSLAWVNLGHKLKLAETTLVNRSQLNSY